MLFKHPEILYALFLLLIPIFIHLFQLRRFQRIDFTNVAFLRKVTVQTRKSSKLKKWLTLLMRLLALACIIIAFAQPYSTSKTAVDKETETVLYIDNSFSMQARGANGPLLERALQDLFDKVHLAKNISWFTNDTQKKNVSVQDFQNDILDVQYSTHQLNPSQVLLKANQLFSKEKDVYKQLIYISDFQQRERFPDIPENLQVKTVQLQPVKASNVSIDSAFIASKNSSTIQLKVKVSKQGETSSEVPVSLFNKEKLISKTAVEFNGNSRTTMVFDIDGSEEFMGKLEITEANIPFDNTLYFSINKPEKIKVLAINEADGGFLQRLFDDEKFQLTVQGYQALDYSLIPDQNFIILNQLKEIPSPLATALLSFTDSGGRILVIPDNNSQINSYNSFLTTVGMGTISKSNQQSKQITDINFSHPLFQDVFEKEVANFQYPKVNTLFEISSSGAPALRYEDGKPFLVQKNHTYLFTAAIDQDNSNFQNSPLVVPTIYNMGLQSLPLADLYYTIGNQNSFAVPIQLGQDEILSIRDEGESFIPMQQSKANHVKITTTENPAEAGNYEIIRKKERIQNVSFNYSRQESQLQYQSPDNWKGVENFSSVNDLFLAISEANSIHGFWKWFVIFAVLFLIAEMVILKFWK